MKTLNTSQGVFGPFQSIVQTPEGWRCDGIDFLTTIVGEATVRGVSPAAPEPLPDPEAPSGPAVPESVPMLNAHLIIIHAGQMDALKALVAQLPEQDRLEAEAYLNLAQNCRRDNKWVALLGAGLGYDSAGLDQLFIAAAALNP